MQGIAGGGFDVVAERLAGSYILRPSQPYGRRKLGHGCFATEGESVIENAASDPEIVDFVHLLQKMGADVEGAYAHCAHSRRKEAARS